jgi:biotin-dependent carboxylase-like uncharacterized protein
MTALLRVITAAIGSSVQDRGRRGYRHLGVPLSGALDGLLLAAANILVGNPLEAAGLELLLAGTLLEVVAGHPRVALAGDGEIRLHRAATADRASVAGWRSVSLAPGDQVSFVLRGIAYLAVSGGILVPLCLGSRSTYARAGLGTLLAPGVVLPCAAAAPGADVAARQAWREEAGPMRVLPGPQAASFSAAAQTAFYGQTFHVGRDRDRMGLRLDGPHLAATAPEIVTDGVAPGAIQVSADGRAIVLLADAQTTGGYPKIATLIRADLPRLAHLQPGEALAFRAVTPAEAACALDAQSLSFASWCAGLYLAGGDEISLSATLGEANLAGDAVRGDENF